MLTEVLDIIGSSGNEIGSEGLRAITNSSTRAGDEALRYLIDLFLDDTETNPSKHQSIMLGVSAATGISRFGRLSFGNIGNAVVDCILDPSKVLEYLNFAVNEATQTQGNSPTMWFREALAMRDQILASPNIEGIPIQSSKESCTRSVNISEQQVMVTSGYRKTVSDNAVPLPRKWTIEGYITSVSRVDDMYYHKPSISYQVLFLDEVACSHKPVWYKSYDGRYYLVQVTNFNSSRTPDANNAVAVNLELTEYNPLTVSSTLTPITANVGNWEEVA